MINQRIKSSPLLAADALWDLVADVYHGGSNSGDTGKGLGEARTTLLDHGTCS